MQTKNAKDLAAAREDVTRLTGELADANAEVERLTRELVEAQRCTTASGQRADAAERQAASAELKLEQYFSFLGHIEIVLAMDPREIHPTAEQTAAVDALSNPDGYLGLQTSLRELAEQMGNLILIERLQQAQAAATLYAEFYRALTSVNAFYQTWERLREECEEPEHYVSHIRAGDVFFRTVDALEPDVREAVLEALGLRLGSLRAQLQKDVYERYAYLIRQAVKHSDADVRRLSYSSLLELRKTHTEVVNKRVDEWNAMLLLTQPDATMDTFDGLPNHTADAFLTWAPDVVSGDNDLAAAIILRCALNDGGLRSVYADLVPADTQRKILELARKWDQRQVRRR